MTNHFISFKACWWLVTIHMLFSSCTAKCVIVLPPCFLVINLHGILQKGIIEKGIDPQRQKCSKEVKIDNAWSEIQIEHSRVIEEIPVHGNVGTAILQETWDLWLEGLRKGRLISISEESGCDKKDECPRGGDVDK